MSQRSNQAGFSAVELLITIFIAAAFVGAGYQLYIVVSRSSADARDKATASAIAYEHLRKYTPLATNPCTVVTPTPAPAIPTGSPNYAALTNPSITASISCPYAPSSSGVSLVTVTVTYGPASNQKQVQHSVYVTN